MEGTLGFIGTGTITAAMVRGLKASPLAHRPIILSPRNAETAAALSALPGVRVAPGNQQVLDASDLVVLAVRPQVAEAVLRPLRFRPGQTVISLIAGLDIARLTDWTGATNLCRAIPLPFVERRADAVPVHPPLPQAMALFAALGQALPVEDRASFDIYAALSALMGSYFGLVETAEAWAAAQGLPPAASRPYLSRLLANLGTVLAASPATPQALRQDHSTPGGLNEQLFRSFSQDGGPQALQDALFAVLARIRGG